MNDIFHQIGDWHNVGVEAACVILRDTQDRYLLQLRDSNSATFGSGQWGIFGGRLEQGETPRCAALREIHEEIGVTLKNSDIAAFAKCQSAHGTRLYAFTTPRRIAPIDITLGEGAGFAFLTRDQLNSMPVLPTVAAILHHFFEINPDLRVFSLVFPNGMLFLERIICRYLPPTKGRTCALSLAA
jgi:8-oxo-dGTP diphosphatase